MLRRLCSMSVVPFLGPRHDGSASLPLALRPPQRAGSARSLAAFLSKPPDHTWREVQHANAESHRETLRKTNHREHSVLRKEQELRLSARASVGKIKSQKEAERIKRVETDEAHQLKNALAHWTLY